MMNLPNPLAIFPTPGEFGKAIWNVASGFPLVGLPLRILELPPFDELALQAERSAISTLPGPHEMIPPPHEVLPKPTEIIPAPHEVIPEPAEVAGSLPGLPALPTPDLIPEPVEVIDAGMQGINLFMTQGLRGAAGGVMPAGRSPPGRPPSQPGNYVPQFRGGK